MNLILNILICFCLAGCYEGWDYDRSGGPEDSEPPTPPEPKPISYILFQPIFPTATGIQSGLCGVDANFLEYRKNEWAERIAAAAVALREIAETVVESEIPVSDCSDMHDVEAAPLDLAPWGSGAAPEQDPAGRSEVHLKAIFWDGDVGLTPGGLVTSPDWTVWANLISGGRNARSMHYFVHSNSTNGYVSSWVVRTSLAGTTIDSPNPSAAGIAVPARLDLARTAIDSPNLISAGIAVPARLDLAGTAIDSPNPSAAGIAERKAIIAADSQKLASWVLSEATK
jgi:hypothetical protein